MTTNPADAVREAHNSLVRVKASRLSIQHADDLLAIEGGIDALHNRIADLTERVAELEQANELLCRWKGRIDEARMSRGLEFPADYDNSPIYGVQSLLEATRLAALAGVAPVAHGVVAENENVKVEAGFVYENGVHTPTVLLSFNPDDWAARDQFVAKVKAPHAPAKAREDDARDARRYRFLRDTADSRTGHPFIARRNAFGVSAWNGEHADAAIDAALATFAEGAETSDERRE